MMKKYREDIDILKGISILVVVLYHMGFLWSGYLGVDVFLVINGFLVIPFICRKIQENGFSYREFITKRFTRLLPLLTIAVGFCLLWGCIFMLPDNLYGLGKYSISTMMGGTNLMSIYSASNYWDTGTVYNPLMHFWYIGVLIQFYLIFGFIVFLFRNRIKSNNSFNKLLYVIAAISILLYAMPQLSIDTGFWRLNILLNNIQNKFYMIQYRLFEFAIGGLIGCNIARIKALFSGKDVLKYILTSVSFVFVVIFVTISVWSEYPLGHSYPVVGIIDVNKTFILPNEALVILVSVFTVPILVFGDEISFKSTIVKLFKSTFVWLGRNSYDLFVWHQILLAMMFMLWGLELTFSYYLIYAIIVIVASWISAKYIERILWTKWMTLAAVTCIAFAFFIVYKGGIIHDVPELRLYSETPEIDKYSHYSDRIYKMNKPFPDNGKVNVLLLGNSFTRDMVNVILESKYRDSVNIHYEHHYDNSIVEHVRKCDVLLTFGPKYAIEQYIWDNLPEGASTYGISSKNFGTSMMQVYRRRWCEDYYSTMPHIASGYNELNQKWKEEWGDDHYIDFHSLIAQNDGMGGQ